MIIHRTLAQAARHAQRLANLHGMRYSVVAAGSYYRIRLGSLPAVAPFIVLHPQGR